ncbi:MAG: glutamine--fructose-6-phosphate transaminase (isomerizing) [Euryarchaeota archaeon]|nr:glutamine--fructose-6-phosphate transaminase (isomerizing) [Euryarchaeota archaeon]MBU4608131.1 glutamine--fructose-6-phosphate transaminase (isomerizing) [Euryarchaeota archaeon]MBV1728959.1 glutamine--fructose-6-phosphate transaminase (isomerizing) [Methanobacterium sp.]MBV1755628.1 glutamine--fructose-6-phosphate transaminase (isomerizing) [Methanobacterium sp.]
MCGIVGCILKKEKTAPVLLECVKKLEYRGYDSVGIATLTSEIHIKKDRGKISEVDKKVRLSDLPGNMGIAHVRWATHGIPTKVNSHPHTDCNGTVAVVHNGIIENFKELKADLISQGHVFKSETDTEIIPHLIERNMESGSNLENSLRAVLKDIQGSYAIAVMSSLEPGKIIGVRKESPLIVGKGDGEYFLASDVPAILKHTKNIIYLEDDEMVILDKKGVTIKNKLGEITKKEVHIIDWTPDMAEKGGYDHFMIKEIHEQPEAIKNTLMELGDIEKIVNKLGNVKRICFVACGTSYHASLIGKYLFESLGGIPTDVLLASEFKYSAGSLDKDTLVILISQSGETADTLKALRNAKNTSKTLAIVNVLGSTATREADHIIYTRAGPEIGVAATKTYISQLTCIYMLAGLLCGHGDLIDKLHEIPQIIQKMLDNEDYIKAIAQKYRDAQDFFFIGRGFSYPTALEGALKLKEITYIHGEGYAAGELKHGPLALIDDEVPVVAVTPPGESHDKTVSNVEEVRARGAHVIAVGAESDEGLQSEAEDVMGVDDSIDEVMSPIPYVVPLQLLSYYMSVARGINPDKPKNLAKCVTVE